MKDDCMNYAADLTELIGNTPLLKLKRLSGTDNIFAKCEFLNPMSVKDRPVLWIIEEAERSGQLKPDGTLIEATSGNTGIAVASIAAIKGYRAILVMSEIQSLERRKILQALGAELVLTPAKEGTVGARRKLKQLCKQNPEYFYVGQHVNPNNPEAHFKSTGPEIWEDTQGKVDILVTALGTGGTICGSGRFLKSKKPSIELIAIEPSESPFISQGIFKPHRLMGTAPGFVPETLDREIIDEIFLVSEQEAFSLCRRIARKEGLLVGISSGAVAHASLEISQRDGNKAKLIVCVFADTGERYLSVEGLF
jgi:cysteine synthase A